MYDFANSGYTTVVITAVFNAYFVGVVAAGAPWATLAWTIALAVSYAVAMVLGPLLGSYADLHGCKKRLLVFTTVGCVGFTAALALVGAGDVWLGIALIIASNLFFSLGENLVAAFLPELARPEALGKLSGWGWSVGYLGGLISLGASLAWVAHAQAAGQGSAAFVPVCMLITAVIFALAVIPTFAYLQERARPRANEPAPSPSLADAPGARAVDGAVWQGAFGQLRESLRALRAHPDLERFLACIVCYQAGVQTVVALAAIYAEQALGFQTADTIKLILLVNITAALGAAAFGQIQDRIGHVRTLAITLVGWLIAIGLAWASQGPGMFWVAANVVGLCLGASQSAGRALVGYLSPAARRAEFFGLWGVAVKLSSILGPVSYGIVSWVSNGDHRLAILITGVFFVAGLAVLRTVDATRGRACATTQGAPVDG
ncbi:MAG: MFS transporter [Proteobacteria bacterium]|nr:MFS transporter [Burkholderiales bacterium]